MKHAVPFAASLLLLLGPTFASAQTGTLEGVVTHAESGAPLVDVTITLAGTDRGVLSGPEGGFRFADVPAGRYTVVARLLGYREERRRVRVGVAQTVELEVELAEDAVEIGGITVVARTGGFVATDEAAVGKADVPASELPQSISVVTRAQLAMQDVTSLAQATRYTPGVQSEPFGFEPRLTFIRIRGFDATTSGLYRDGLQLRNPGFAVGYNLEPYGAERIEVLKGPSSVFYGAGSPGGIVNYVSKRPTFVPLRELELEVGSHERFEGKVDLTGGVGESQTFAYRLTALVRESDTQVDFIGNDRTFVAPTFLWRPGQRTSVTVFGKFKDDETRASQALPASGLLFENPNGEVPPDRFTGEPDVDRYDRSHSSGGYEIEHIRSTWTLIQKLRYYDIDLDDVTVFTTGLEDDQRTISRSIFGSFGELDGLTLDNQARGEIRTGSVLHGILIGIDFQSIDAKSRQTFGAAPPLDVFAPEYGAGVEEPAVFADRVTDQRQVGIYVQNRMKLEGGLVLSLAGRYDWADTEVTDNLADGEAEQDDNEFSGRVGLSWLAPLGFMPYASYSESFLPVAGTDPEGETFEPEKGEQWELGLKFTPREWNATASIAYFHLTREGFVQFDPETFVPVQTGEVVSRGVELQAAATLDVGLDLVGSVTLVDVEVTESANPAELEKRPTQTPEETASVWANYTLRSEALEGLGFGLGVRHVGSTFGDVANELEVPSVTLVDGAIYYDWRGFRLAVNAQNLLDDEYVASAFQRADPLATFGPTRRLTGSLRYRW